MVIKNIQLLSNITELGKRYDMVATIDGKNRFCTLSIQESLEVPEFSKEKLQSFAAEKLLSFSEFKKYINESWKKTGKTKVDVSSGKTLYEYAEFKKGKFTGKVVFKDQYGKLPDAAAWIPNKLGEDVGSFDGNISVDDIKKIKPNDQVATNVPFKHTVYIEPQMKSGVMFGYTFDENGNKIYRVFENMTQVHEWAKSLNAEVVEVSDM